MVMYKSIYTFSNTIPKLLISNNNGVDNKIVVTEKKILYMNMKLQVQLWNKDQRNT